MTSHHTSDTFTPIRDAASVMLLRDGHQGIEIFTLTRVSTMQFAAGATVFPGGGFEPEDNLIAKDWSGVEINPRARDGLLGDDDATWRRLIVTAIRETFEETGVLLGMTHGKHAPTPQARENTRHALDRKDLDLGAVYSDFALSPNLSCLIPVARWITPEGRPRRYDTRFFVTQAPLDQEPLHIPGEARSAQWTEPRTALSQLEDGTIHLMRPTESLLRALVSFSSVAEALQAAPFQAEVQPP